MKVISIVSTKGGVGKTTVTANLGGFAADAGLRVLLIDLDGQPTLYIYFPLPERASAGIYELLAFNERKVECLVSQTAILRLDIVLSNDEYAELNTLLLHAADGWLRLRNLLPMLAPFYDLVLIDTQGARSVTLEMAVLASDMAVSPVTPEILSARELNRGTLKLIEDIAPYQYLGIAPPPVRLLINRLYSVPRNARLVQRALRDIFATRTDVQILATVIPDIEAYPKAAIRGLPVHRVEYRKPVDRTAPAALETMRALACELFPTWQEAFARVTGRPPAKRIARDAAGSAADGEPA